MLEIRLLGRYGVSSDGSPIQIRSRPARTLLAYLVLTLGTQHPRERLAGLLWPDSTEANARKNLRQALWRLRKSIGEGHLLADVESVAFDSNSTFWLDVAALEHPGEEDLEAVAATYEGELLPGFYEDWVLLERDRLAAVFERRMERLMADLQRQERWDEARDWAERWIAQGQIPEAAYRALMLSHAASGELPKVEADYQRCVEALQQELGVEPSNETRALYASLMAGEVPLGRPSMEPPGLPPARRPHLPAQPTTFIGREAELAEARQLLGDARLLTLTGPGGIGKTRLALKLAEDLQEQFADGAYFVNLAAIDRASDLTQLVADAIAFPLSSDDVPDEQLLRYLRSKRLLLVMDNFEHVLDGAPLVSKILQTSSEVKVLATSREKLELQGEASLGVRGMSFPETTKANDARNHDAIELFNRSARRVLPSFDPDAGMLEHVHHICQLVQGMPLGIELAAAWLNTLTLDEIESELRHSLDILSTEMRDVPQRHRNIRAAFDHSWSLASPAEHEAFTRLSVFRGGFTRDAAQEVAGATLELLASLVGKSFLRHDPETGRFEIHELMRQYGAEKLDADPAESRKAHDAHASYYAGLMNSRWDHLRDSRQLAALEEIDADIENVRTAWRYASRQVDLPRMWQFVQAMRLVYFIRGWNYAGMELFAEAVSVTQAASDGAELEALHALAQAHQGFFMAWLGLAEQGIELARQAAEVLRRLDRPEELSQALSTIVLCAQYLGLHTEHEQSVDELLQISEDRQDRWLEAYSLFLRSLSRLQRGDFQGAGQSAQRSLQISEDLGDLVTSLYAQSALGAVAQTTGDYEQARARYSASRQMAEQLGLRWAIENNSKYLGHVALAQGEIDEAETHLHRSLRIANEIGLGRDLMNLLYDFARVWVKQDRREEAIELLGLVIGHPASTQARFTEGPIRGAAQDLLDELEKVVPPEAYSAALERGKTMELDQAVAGLMVERQSVA